jgi:hypothetical protein
MNTAAAGSLLGPADDLPGMWGSSTARHLGAVCGQDHL